jgi:acetyl/propionyl-CoA carboxylase alpha subunit
MKYEVTLNDKSIPVSIEEIGRFQYSIKIDGKEMLVDAHRTEACVYSILIDGKSYEVDVSFNGDDFRVNIDGETYKLNVIDERRKALKKIVSTGRTTGVQIITAPMPGRVVRILKKPGERVEKNQGVIIVEAMKMENELKVNNEGVVKNIFVKEGDTVEAGQKLVEVG